MKKYSDKFLNETDKLKDSRIGFEFEFYLKELSFYKTLELLNQYLSPVKVWGFRQYHSDFTPDENNFKIEPDLSGGSNMVELVTGALTYFDAKYFLIKIVKFIQEHGYTNEKCSIHFNLSFESDKKDLNDLNILKLILNTDEDEIYRMFPSRQNNIYAKSIKKIIPYKEYDYFNIPIGIVKNGMRLPSDKYYGINFINIIKDKSKQRLEYRYIGGKDYEKNIGQLIYFMEKFIINTYDSIDVEFDIRDSEKLEEYLEYNISVYKNLSNYDKFIVDFPTIQLQIDQSNRYELVSSYYTKIYNKIFNLIDSTDDLKECLINYVTNTQTLEIIDADIKCHYTIKTVDFVNCKLDGLFDDCFLIDSEVNNSQLTKCKLQDSTANMCKVINCNVEMSELKDCYFVDGYLNGSMYGGVYRSGKLGPMAVLDSEVKIIKDYDNFFDTIFDSEEDKGEPKGFIKGFGKK